MKKLFSLLLLGALLVVADASVATAAQIENVGPTGDKMNSGDLNARRYARMYERWNTENTDSTQAALEQRYRAAPQVVQLAQEDPAMPSMQAAAQGNCPVCNCSGQPTAAPRGVVQQQSLQPLYNQQTNSGMVPVVITADQY